MYIYDGKTESQKYAESMAEDIIKAAEHGILYQYLFGGELPDDDVEEGGEKLSDIVDEIGVERAQEYDYIVNERKEYRHCKIWLTLGGPTAWIDTSCNAVKCAWGSGRGEAGLPAKVCREIDCIMFDLYSYC